MSKLVLAVVLFVAATAGAAPSPIKGAYHLVTLSDGKKTVAWNDVLKTAKQAGEVVLSFEGDQLGVGIWTLARSDDPKRPTQTLVAICRNRVTVAPAWSGKSFTLPFDLKVEGWASAFLVTKTKKGKDTHTTTWHNEPDCSFGLDKDTYALAVTRSDGEGPTNITLTSSKLTMQLERAKPISELDTKAAMQSFLGD